VAGSADLLARRGSVLMPWQRHPDHDGRPVPRTAGDDITALGRGLADVARLSVGRLRSAPM
jgi:hypothetical protein